MIAFQASAPLDLSGVAVLSLSGPVQKGASVDSRHGQSVRGPSPLLGRIGWREGLARFLSLIPGAWPAAAWTPLTGEGLGLPDSGDAACRHCRSQCLGKIQSSCCCCFFFFFF